jgi:hypothetical protein
MGRPLVIGPEGFGVDLPDLLGVVGRDKPAGGGPYLLNPELTGVFDA